MAIRMVRQPVLQAYTMSTSPGVVFTTATRYWPIAGCGEATATIFSSNNTFPLVGTVVRAEVALAAAPGTGNSLTFTLFKNGSTTGFSVTVSGSSLTGSATGSVTAALGDLFEWQSTGSGTPSCRGGLLLYVNNATQ